MAMNDSLAILGQIMPARVAVTIHRPRRLGHEAGTFDAPWPAPAAAMIVPGAATELRNIVSLDIAMAAADIGDQAVGQGRGLRELAGARRQ